VFSEEDLTRHLQIMLRTHGELGYRQEQRFHLELGLLKMAHAQRLLPIEQLLSDAAASTSGLARTAPRPVLASPTEGRRNELPSPPRSSSVSPFAADSARKGTPKAESSEEIAVFADKHALCAVEGSLLVAQPSSGTSANLVIMGSAAPAVEELSTEPDPQPVGITEVKAQVQTATKPAVNADSLREAVLNALCNQQMLVSMLESAEWKLEANTLIARVAASSTMIEMSFTSEARRMASAAASGLAGKPIKMQVDSGGASQAASAPRRLSLNGSARSRAEQDPIVQRMQEKFGAEIRTVIDYREKG
jgi:DNA polymerase III subunit gamma/tau